MCLSLCCYVILCVNSSFAIILKRKRKLVALLLLSYIRIVSINVLWLFLTVPRVDLQLGLWYFLIILTYLSDAMTILTQIFLSGLQPAVSLLLAPRGLN